MLEKAGQSFFQWDGLDLVSFVDVLLGVRVSLTTGGGGLLGQIAVVFLLVLMRSFLSFFGSL